MSKRLIIAGAGGFGRGIYGWVTTSPNFLNKLGITNVCFIDDSETSYPLEVPVIGTIRDYSPKSADLFLCAIGNPDIRLKVVHGLSDRGAKFQTFIDDRAIIGANVTVGKGAVVCPGVVISAGALIRDQVHINFNCSIGHDTEIGPYSTLSPAVNLMGELKIGSSVFFGGNAAVLPRLKIGSHAQIGAGAVVTKNVPEDVTVTGVPGHWHE